MSTEDAAEYLSIGQTMIREKGPVPVRIGRRRLYDIRALDRWADQLSGQPLNPRDHEQASAEAERQFFERRRARSLERIGNPTRKE